MAFLGIDIGTGGSRACLIDAEGKVLASATADHVPFASPHMGWAEQDPEDWWRAACEVTKGVLAAKGIRSEDIDAVGFSGQMHGSVLLDESDAVIRPALLWCDQRTGEECNEITKLIGKEQLIGLVSNPAVTGFTLPKLLWIRDHEPDVWNRIRSVLLPKDFIRLRLTDSKATDVTDASGTLLFDVRARKWSREMFLAFGIRPDLLPKVFESTEAVGTVSRSGALATGLLEGTPVVAGAGDNAAGAIGMGIVSPGTVSATVGTSGVVFVVTDSPTIDMKGRIHSMCHAIPDRWHMTGVTLSAGLSLRWFRDTIGGGSDYDDLVAEAATVSAGCEGVIWLPYLMGERSPHLDPKARGAFVGLSASHTRGHLCRAVLEGVAFSLRDSVEIFQELQVPIDKIRLGGGGARSNLWRQIQADVFGHAVETIQAEEGAAFGAAILAGVGVGAWASVENACERTIRVAERVKPDPASSEELERNYQAYKLLYSALRPAMNLITGATDEQLRTKTRA